MSQDPLENYFGQQRARGRRSDNPSVAESVNNASSLWLQRQVAQIPMRGNSRRRRRLFPDEVVKLPCLNVAVKARNKGIFMCATVSLKFALRFTCILYSKICIRQYYFFMYSLRRNFRKLFFFFSRQCLAALYCSSQDAARENPLALTHSWTISLKRKDRRFGSSRCADKLSHCRLTSSLSQTLQTTSTSSPPNTRLGRRVRTTSSTLRNRL